jgi:antitoxin component YwqK of YwqJK toxin-antitoxin module
MGAKGSFQRYLPITGAALFVLFVGPASVDASADLDRFELLGPVKTVVTKHPQLRTTHHFDRNGLLTSLELSPTNGTDSARYVFLHDATGRVIEEQTFEPNGTLIYKKIFRYGLDEQGRQTALVAATDTGAFTHAEFEIYDHRGFLAEELYISGHGAIEKSLFDVRGNLVYQARYYEGKLVQEATHHYSPLGRLKESRHYGLDGELMRRDLYRYNETGQRIEQHSEIFRQSHLRKSVVTFEFDYAGNWIKETIQQWTDKGGSLALTETVVSRERILTYYGTE